MKKSGPGMEFPVQGAENRAKKVARARITKDIFRILYLKIYQEIQITKLGGLMQPQRVPHYKIQDGGHQFEVHEAL
jgi:hypothetical protein